MNSFADFGLRPSLLKTLKQIKIFKPTEIQSTVIPLMMSGQTVVGVSETGSGKTLTYALPLLHALKALEDDDLQLTESASPRAIVMVPTRELGEQVAKVFKLYTHDTRLRVRSALGGMTFEQARRNIADPFEILLATPGRIVQLLEKDLLKMDEVRMVIFDEADQMLDQGFLPDSEVIVKACPYDVQLSLFSATVSKSVQELMNLLFSNAEVIRSSGSGQVVSQLKTQNRKVIDGKRWPLLEKILKEPLKKDLGGTLLFTNTREQCDALAAELLENGYQCVIYRGEMEPNERRANLKKFRAGQVDLMVSTDLAARGLDIPLVGRVINYHLPKQKQNYIHRAGRTARAGRPGLVVNLVTERDEKLIADLEGRKFEKKMGPREGKPVYTLEEKRALKPKVKKTLKTFSKVDSNKTSAVKPISKGPSVKLNSKFKSKPKFVPKPKPKALIEFEMQNKPKAPLSAKRIEKNKRFRSYGPKK